MKSRSSEKVVKASKNSKGTKTPKNKKEEYTRLLPTEEYKPFRCNKYARYIRKLFTYLRKMEDNDIVKPLNYLVVHAQVMPVRLISKLAEVALQHASAEWEDVDGRLAYLSDVHDYLACSIEEQVYLKDPLFGEQNTCNEKLLKEQQLEYERVEDKMFEDMMLKRELMSFIKAMNELLFVFCKRNKS